MAKGLNQKFLNYGICKEDLELIESHCKKQYRLRFANTTLQKLITIELLEFQANARYSLIMNQQSIADGVIKDLLVVNGREFQEIKSKIAS